MELFLKECSRSATSIVYWIFIALLFISWYQNYNGVTTDEINRAENSSDSSSLFEYDRPILKEPLVNDDYFGMKTVEDPDKIMLGAVDQLLSEYEENVYATYPFGYYKAVVLSDSEQKQVLAILSEITGLTEEQLQNIPETYFPSTNGTIIHFPEDTNTTSGEIELEMGDNAQSSTSNDKTQTFISQVTYKRFKELMSGLEGIIGSGSQYSIDMLTSYFGITEMTYEEAVEEYKTTINEDGVTGSFARLFSDYLSIPLGLYPVFLVVLLWLKDLKTNAVELMYPRKVSSVKLLISRYSAGLVMIMIPVILLSFESLIPLISFGIKNGLTIDCFAYLKYILWWILPTIMIVTALGTLLTILTDSPIAILLQLLWWFVDRGMTGLTGDTSLLTLMIRHNKLGGYNLVQNNLHAIWQNRLFLTALSLLLVMLSIWILIKKRRGKLDFWSLYTKLFGTVKAKFSNKHIS